MTAQQLNSSVLQLAIQGKLVSQNLSDEPASQLLKRIQAEKNRLIYEGKIKKGKDIPPVTEDEIPYDIPDNWTWCKLDDVAYSVGNKSNQIQANDVKDTGKYPAISQGKELIDGYCDCSAKVISDLPLVMFGDHTRNVKYIDYPFVISADGTKFFKPIFVNAKYLYYWMTLNAELIRNRGYARHYTLLKQQCLALPPIEEQQRIVEKIEKLLPYVDEYGVAERRRLELNSIFPEQIRKSILQEAVQGKLVPQNPDDEPASKLLKRIRAEKIRLLSEGRIKKEKPLPPISDDEIPFDIPESWVWVRFSDVIDVATNLVSPNEYGDYMHIAPDNIEKNTGRLLECRTVKDDHVESPNHLFEAGQLIYSKIRPLLRKVVISPFKGLCSADMYPLNTLLVKEYIKLLLLSECFNQQVAAIASNRIKMPKINQKELSRIVIPIPPFSEQRRIVVRAEELLGVCDELVNKN